MDFNAAISSVSTLIGIAKGAIAARDDIKAQEALTNIQLKLMDVMAQALAMTEKNMTLVQEFHALQARITELEAKSVDREEYVLTDVCPGFQAYRSLHYKSNDPNRDNPYHLLCQACYDQGSKFMLRFEPHFYNDDASKNYSEWVCPENSRHNFKQR